MKCCATPARRRTASLLRLLILPASLALYGAVAVRAQCSPVGILDALAFVLLGVLVQMLLLCWRQRWIRFVGVYAVTLFWVVFFVGNTAYWRFFQTWVHPEIFAEWDVGPQVSWDAIRTLDWTDWALGVALPLLAAFFVAWRRLQTFRLRLTVPAVVLLLAGTLAFHRTGVSVGLVAREQNPFMYFARDWGGRLWRYATRVWRAQENRDRACRIASRPWRYFPRGPRGYRLETLEEYPLVREPATPTTKPVARVSLDRLPNIVLVLMESMRAYESGAYGANPSFTPRLDELARKGVVFRNFYANGTKTVHGEFAVLCSYYPRYGMPTYTYFPQLRVESLPSILKQHGYKTLWIYAYTERFAYQGRFLRMHGISEVYDQDSMPENMPVISAWGKADHALFEQAEEILDRQTGPFFAEILTLSNHNPWDWAYPTIDQTPKIEASEPYVWYTRGVYYTDWAIGRFMDRMRGKPYFDNTIFVFVADHGTWAVLPWDRPVNKVRRLEVCFRIPMILYAPKLISPAVVETLGSQVDIAPTVLSLLGLHGRNAFLGRSLLQTNPEDPPRYALMITGNQWNARIGNKYLYRVEKHGSDYEGLAVPASHRADSDPHVYFTSEGDLLRMGGYRGVEFCPDTERTQMLRWFEDIVFVTNYLRDANRICPP